MEIAGTPPAGRPLCRAAPVAKAQEVQESLLGRIPQNGPTDQELTNSPPKRVFSGRKVFGPKF